MKSENSLKLYVFYIWLNRKNQFFEFFSFEKNRSLSCFRTFSSSKALKMNFLSFFHLKKIEVWPVFLIENIEINWSFIPHLKFSEFSFVYIAKLYIKKEIWVVMQYMGILKPGLEISQISGSVEPGIRNLGKV